MNTIVAQSVHTQLSALTKPQGRGQPSYLGTPGSLETTSHRTTVQGHKTNNHLSLYKRNNLFIMNFLHLFF